MGNTKGHGDQQNGQEQICPGFPDPFAVQQQGQVAPLQDTTKNKDGGEL